ncbi:MAG: hypothetical protein ACJ763_06100 [Bdellovibrionia bacterium]
MRLACALGTALPAALAAVFSITGYAATEVANSANVLVCEHPSRPLELLDYFELRQAGGKLTLNPTLGNYTAVLRGLFQNWKSVAPKRIALYERWLSDFEKEAGFYSGIQISPSKDIGAIGIPDGCEIVPAAYQHPDEEIFPNVKRYVFSKDLWDHLPEVEKAGLVLHELIYREATQARHSSSYPTRYFNGYLASAAPTSLEYAQIVQKLEFEWVEFGSGLVLELKKGQVTPYPYQPPRYSKITETGFVTGNEYNPSTYDFPFNDYQKGKYLGFVGDVSSEHLKIQFKSFSPGTTYIDSKVMITGTEVLLSDLSKTRVENISASIDRASVELSHLPIQLMSYQLSVNKSRLQIKVATQDVHPDALNVNPATSFYVQPDGSIIRSITSILKNDNCPPDCYQPQYALYGDALVTEAGEKWAYDSGKARYIRK